MDAIMTRRSVRKFETRKIPDAVLETIIRAGTYAVRPRSPAMGFCGGAGPGSLKPGLGLLQT
ncbi:MAG: nitroreductase family protein [Desulfobacterales bacterium]|nr:nitroreductase family protein [Desulfobacterales bacterium]